MIFVVSGVEEGFHTLRLLWRISSRTLSVSVARIGVPQEKTHTPRSFRRRAALRVGRRVTCWPSETRSKVSPGSRRSSSRTFLGNTRRPGLSTVIVVSIICILAFAIADQSTAWGGRPEIELHAGAGEVSVSLMATSRLSLGSQSRQISPMPPAPRGVRNWSRVSRGDHLRYCIPGITESRIRV